MKKGRYCYSCDSAPCRCKPVLEPYKTILERIEDLRRKMMEIDGKIYEEEQEMLKHLTVEAYSQTAIDFRKENRLREPTERQFDLGEEYCPNNGARLCVYEHLDHAHLSCLFCGQPDERK